KLASASVHGLRDELLEIPGINPETADAVLLEGLGLPTAVVDLQAWRGLTPPELAAEDPGYEGLREVVEKGLPRDEETQRSFHVLTGELGRDFCRSKARCERCPLKPYLPGGK